MKQLFILMLAAGFIFASCNDDDAAIPPTEGITLSFSDLPDLGADFVYEGWLAGSNGVVSAGRFTVDANGMPSQSQFTFDAGVASVATAYILTIEPANETGAALDAPSDVHILAGDFNGSSAALTIGDPRAIGTDFSSIAGSYILATPTTAETDDELSGVWFIELDGGPQAALELPTLAAGWKYEGWAVIDGTPYSTGTFLTAMGSDDSAMFSGPQDGPPFPGEDFIQGGGSVAFPTNLQGATIVISVEPDPDNEPAPFALKPLVGNVPMDALDHVSYNLNQNLVGIPTGTIMR